MRDFASAVREAVILLALKGWQLPRESPELLKPKRTPWVCWPLRAASWFVGPPGMVSLLAIAESSKFSTHHPTFVYIFVGVFVLFLTILN